MIDRHEIHPTAIVDPGARLGSGVRIGPFCTVGGDAVLQDGVELVSHAVIDGHTVLEEGVRIFPFATIGLAPQDLKYRGEPTRTVIGAGSVIREHCSIHRGTVTGSGVTRIGRDCLLMAVVHVAHDCEIGDGVIMSNNVVLGGHVSVGERAVIGGSAAVLQFVRIGAGAMVGGVTGVTADVLPHAFVFGPRARLCGLNIVGLRRRGLEKSALHELREAYRFLFAGPGLFAARVAAAGERYAGNRFVGEMLRFIETPSRHGLITTLSRATGEDE